MGRQSSAGAQLPLSGAINNNATKMNVSKYQSGRYSVEAVIHVSKKTNSIHVVQKCWSILSSKQN